MLAFASFFVVRCFVRFCGVSYVAHSWLAYMCWCFQADHSGNYSSYALIAVLTVLAVLALLKPEAKANSSERKKQ